MSEYLRAIATELSLVNLAICGAIFSKIETGRSSGVRTADALKAMIATLVILSLAALFGAKVPETFGVSLDAFSVAGGFVLAWMGFAMLKGDSPGSGGSAKDDSSDGASLTSLILFASGPGTMIGVIALAVAHSTTEIPVTTLVAIGVTVAITFCAIMILSSFSGKNQGGIVREAITSFTGLIVIATGVQLALTGFKSFMV